MANQNTSYVCSVCGVSSDNRQEALIHAKGPLHAGKKFSQLYPDSPEVTEIEKSESVPMLEKKR